MSMKHNQPIRGRPRGLADAADFTAGNTITMVNSVANFLHAKNEQKMHEAHCRKWMVEDDLTVLKCRTIVKVPKKVQKK